MSKDKDKQKYEKYRVSVAKQYKDRISTLKEDNSNLNNRIGALNSEIKQLKQENSKLEEENSLYKMVNDMSESELELVASFAKMNGLLFSEKMISTVHPITVHATSESINFLKDIANKM